MDEEDKDKWRAFEKFALREVEDASGKGRLFTKGAQSSVQCGLRVGARKVSARVERERERERLTGLQL